MSVIVRLLRPMVASLFVIVVAVSLAQAQVLHSVSYNPAEVTKGGTAEVLGAIALTSSVRDWITLASTITIVYPGVMIQTDRVQLDKRGGWDNSNVRAFASHNSLGAQVTIAIPGDLKIKEGSSLSVSGVRADVSRLAVGDTVAFMITSSPSNAHIFTLVRGSIATVISAPKPCVYSISPATQSFTSLGGAGKVAVTAEAGCSWTANNSDDPWVKITSGQSGTGDGTVSYSVADNTSPSSRTGTLTIAGQTFTATQLGAPGTTLITMSTNPAGLSFTVDGRPTRNLRASPGPWEAAIRLRRRVLKEPAGHDMFSRTGVTREGSAIRLLYPRVRQPTQRTSRRSID